MRRIVSLLLSFVMILTLAACGQSAASEKQEKMQLAMQKTDEPPETSQSGATAEKPDTEMETELSESVSTEEQEVDVGTKNIGCVLFVYRNYGTCSGVCYRDFRS